MPFNTHNMITYPPSMFIGYLRFKMSIVEIFCLQQILSSFLPHGFSACFVPISWKVKIWLYYHIRTQRGKYWQMLPLMDRDDHYLYWSWVSFCQETCPVNWQRFELKILRFTKAPLMIDIVKNISHCWKYCKELNYNRQDSNKEPPVLKSNALPLSWRDMSHLALLNG
jgi:hypothetical protein